MLDLHHAQYDNLVAMLGRGVQTCLVVGDAGVGKRTLVRRAVIHFKDEFDLIEVPKLGIEEARSIKDQSIRMSVRPRIFLIDGDSATIPAYNAMLKLLEEPPSKIVLVICASKPPLQTIVSRCSYLMIPPLTNEELLSCLTYHGMSERAASTVISYARGSVSEALKVYSRLEEKRRLIPFIKALKERDLQFVLEQVKNINTTDVGLMIELIDDVFLARYGLLNQELSSMLPASPDFLIVVKNALIAGQSPAICWMRAWYESGA